MEFHPYEFPDILIQQRNSGTVDNVSNIQWYSKEATHSGFVFIKSFMVLKIKTDAALRQSDFLKDDFVS